MPLLTISPDGTVTQILPKPGKGLDLKKVGPVQIRRSSLIEFDADSQKWFIRFIDASKACVEREDGVATGADWCPLRFLSHVGQPPAEDGLGDATCESQPLRFENYDDAVLVEVFFLEAWRILGQLTE